MAAPRIDFAKVPVIDNDGGLSYVWHARVMLPSGEYHAGRAREQSKALLRAVQRWVRCEAKARAKGKANG
jgi:hypothetical protein